MISIDGAITTLKPLAIFVAGIVVYAIFIFNFYRFIGRKDVIKLDLEKYNKTKHPILKKTFSIIFYTIEYILLFPLFTFFWFAVLTGMLTFLSNDPVITSVLLTAMAVVAAVRITAYYNEDLSKDLAKMLPFALLGIFIVDASYFAFETSIQALSAIGQDLSIIPTLIYYLGFTIALEFVLRILNLLTLPFHKKSKKN